MLSPTEPDKTFVAEQLVVDFLRMSNKDAIYSLRMVSVANNHNPINIEEAEKINWYFPINRSTTKA